MECPLCKGTGQIERPSDYHKGEPCTYASVAMLCQENAGCSGCAIYLNQCPNSTYGWQSI
jgi:hypothetical protein